MNILFAYLTGFSKNGGIEKFNRAFMKALTSLYIYDNEINLKVISLHDSLPDDKYIEKHYFKGYKGNKIYYILDSILNIYRSDWIFIGHVNLSILGLFAKLMRKKVVIIVHGIEVWDINSNLYKYILESSDLILSVSNYTKSKLVNQNIEPNKIVVFPNTLDPYFSPKRIHKSVVRNKYSIHKDVKIILTVARISSTEIYKGYDKILNLLPEIINKYPNVMYLIAGKGEIDEINRLEKIISIKNLHNNVVITGEISDQELLDLYLDSDLFVMPSKKEGFGIVFLEALACGLPVIAGNKDGSREPLLDGKLGILVDPDNPTEIRNAILDVLNNNISKDLSNKEFLTNTVENNFGFGIFKKNLEAVLKLNI